MAGRRPTPTALKVLNGAATKHPERLNKREPKPALGAKPPVWMDTRARQHWRRIAPMLERIKVLTEADDAKLALLCDALVDYLEARDEVAKRGLVLDVPVTNKDGNIIGHRVTPNPAVSARNETRHFLRLLLSDFGMDPTARARVHAIADEPASKDPASAWLERNG